ncbi:MAG TPA: MBL fold metallo-hydrolase [Chloroflexota bacterium]|nr:MBL fold metallo-hydrolase [Chloroflexota bacterium]
MDVMADLAARVAAYPVPAGQVACWWLGGSGFVLKNPGGTQVYIDPYLSDSVQAIFGQGRAFPAPIAPEQARPDVLIVTHWHEDHLDPGTIPLIARHSPRCQFVMPPTAMSRALGWGVGRERIQPLTAGESLTLEGIQITHVPARHESGIPGWEVPDAMGVLITMEGIRIYHTGDTEYDGRLRRLQAEPPDVMMVCINGTGGNMNPHEAALLAWQINAGTVIPMHHLLWANMGDAATRDPARLADTYARLGGRGALIIPHVATLIGLGKRTP